MLGIFMRALELANALPDKALHVGDSLEANVEGAQAAGIAALLLMRQGSGGNAMPNGIATITSLRELLPLPSIKQWRCAFQQADRFSK